MKVIVSLLVFGISIGWLVYLKKSQNPEISPEALKKIRIQEKIAITLIVLSGLSTLYFGLRKKKFWYRMDQRDPVTGHEEIAADIARRECETKKRFLNDLVPKRDECFFASGRVSESDYPLSHERTYMRDFAQIIEDLPCDSLNDVFPKIAADLRNCQSAPADPCSSKVKKATKPLVESINSLKQEYDEVLTRLIKREDEFRRYTPSPQVDRYSPVNFEELE